jgi:transposase
MWCIPEITPEYKARMNEVLSLYERAYDPLLPVVCFDEKSVELHGEKRKPLLKKGCKLVDSEYTRHGTSNIFMMTEPKGGQHFARVTERRTRTDFAECLKWLESKYQDAVTIHLVMDNLNTHNEKSLIKAFGDIVGRRLWARFTPHYTPKHASWLNQAEIAIGIMARCCIGNQRIVTSEILEKTVQTFWKQRSAEKWKIDWGFTVKKANVWIKIFCSQH